VNAAVNKATKKTDPAVEEELAEKAKVSVEKVEDAQRSQLGKWTESFITRDDSDGSEYCSDAALKSSDLVVIGPGGSTRTSSLLSCTKNYFSLDRIKSSIRDPKQYRDDFTCSLAQTCPSNHSLMAKQRAEKIWDNLVSLYHQRLGN